MLSGIRYNRSLRKLGSQYYQLRNSSMRTVTMIEGDGIGPEISLAVKRIFAGAGVPIQWESVEVKPILLNSGKVALSKEVMNSMNKNKIGLKGISFASTIIIGYFMRILI